MMLRDLPRVAVGLLAFTAIAVALWHLGSATRGLEVADTTVGQTPVTVHQRANARPAPVVVIAHGFAGSRQLMAPFAVSLARSGYVAISFDFLGHGRNPMPMAGDVTREDGATEALVAELRRIVDWARALPQGTGDVSLLGHSMASDIIVRAARADPEIAATIAVSMFSEQVTPDAPKNLLMIVGGWEQFLTEASLATLRSSFGADAVSGQTYGSHGSGTARRVAIAENVEHVGVLYSPTSLIEARDWLNGVFAREMTEPVDARGPWIVMLLAGIVAVGWPLAALLPKSTRTHVPPSMASRRFLVIAVLPAILTPLVLWPLPTAFLAVLVADYLALHFALYGALTAGLLWYFGHLRVGWPSGRLIAATVAVTLFCVLGIGLALDAYVASFLPHAGRATVLAVLIVGAVIYTLADEWLIRSTGAAWWWPVCTKILMIASLALAITLDLPNLFFLIIIQPVIILFFLIYGLYSGWTWHSCRHPSVAGVSVGIAFGWALGVTFPILGS